MKTNMDVWREKSPLYPFHAQTEAGQGPRFRGRNDPKMLETYYGPFLRVPLPEIGIVFWGFKTETARNTFKTDFPHAEVPGDVVGVGQ